MVSSYGGHDVDQLLAVLVGLVRQVGGDVDDVELGAELLVVPDEGLHLDEVDDAGEVALGADRQLDARRWSAPRRSLMESSGRVEVGAQCGPSC